VKKNKSGSLEPDLLVVAVVTVLISTTMFKETGSLQLGSNNEVSVLPGSDDEIISVPADTPTLNQR